MNEEELTKELRRLRILLTIAVVALLVLLPAVCLMQAASFLINAKPYFARNLSGYSSPEVIAFRQDAATLVTQMKYDELEAVSSKEVSERPEDAYGHYYLGLAKYYKGDYSNAITSLKKSAQLAPRWEADSIQPYLKKAEEALAGR